MQYYYCDVMTRFIYRCYIHIQQNTLSNPRDGEWNEFVYMLYGVQFSVHLLSIWLKIVSLREQRVFHRLIIIRQESKQIFWTLNF